ncbi:LysR family transcriptional regulator [Manganibacter manganicus]|uniref:LysR family transcriptional regulator n=1 Tax=Manganibacter manganicus TaxID=1873176 RepID=A0A1V8RLI4_9HYPH|nr:LysR family transcriptional regulator [Pseudaminobacter manganicus]OQM74060.1 LysR family transcriptional regulator [Pseudaminobacter manganicus]
MLDTLTLDQLRVLVMVADVGSFSGASRRLQRVQSAISKSIRTLEDALSIQVFDRAGKYPVLTPAGSALVDDARKLLRDADVLKSRARGMAEGLEPELGLAVDPLFPNEVLMRALRELETEFPTLPIRLVTAGLGVPERHLREGAVAVAVYSLETTGADDLDATFLVTIDMVPVVAAGHPLARLHGPIGREDLTRHVQLVLSDTGPAGWQRGLVSQKIWRFADVYVRLEFLLAGFGWCNMPRHLISPALADGRLVQLEIREQTGFQLPLQAVRLSGKLPGLGASALIRNLQTLLKQGEDV